MALLCACGGQEAGRASAASGASAGAATLVGLRDGRRINLRCTGHGAPTVLLEGGFAASSEAWVRVQPQVAQLTRVCSYDRAGYGFSDMGPFPRDGEAIARDLDDVLHAARISGPFVVVGHSAGGLYVRIFADRRWKDVVGMVLVDPSVDHEDERLAPAAGPEAASLAALRDRAVRCLTAAQAGALPSRDPSLGICAPSSTAASQAEKAALNTTAAHNWSTQVSELDTLWSATSDEVLAGRQSYGDMPLIVLTADGTFADVPEPARSRISALWIRLHQDIAARSTRGSERLVQGSSHMMIFDRPDAIVSAIEDVVRSARAAEPAAKATSGSPS